MFKIFNKNKMALIVVSFINGETKIEGTIVEREFVEGLYPVQINTGDVNQIKYFLGYEGDESPVVAFNRVFNNGILGKIHNIKNKEIAFVNDAKEVLIKNNNNTISIVKEYIDKHNIPEMSGNDLASLVKAINDITNLTLSDDVLIVETLENLLSKVKYRGVSKSLLRDLVELFKQLQPINASATTTLTEYKDILSKEVNDVNDNHVHSLKEVDDVYNVTLKSFEDRVYNEGLMRYHPTLVYSSTVHVAALGKEITEELAIVPFEAMDSNRDGISNSNILHDMFDILIMTDDIKGFNDLQVNYNSYDKVVAIKNIPKIFIDKDKLDVTYIEEYRLTQNSDIQKMIEGTTVTCHIRFDKYQD